MTLLAAGKMRAGLQKPGTAPTPSAGWARFKLIPALAAASRGMALAWHTGCEQEQASGPVFALAAKAGLRVCCENSGGIFDSLDGS